MIVPPSCHAWKEKTYKRKFHFLRNLSKEGEVELSYHDQIADIFTKPLMFEVFEKLKKLFGICKISKIVSSSFFLVWFELYSL